MTVANFLPDHRNFLILQIFVESHHPVYDPGRSDLHYSVRHRRYQLLVMRAEENHLREGDQPVVQCGDGFKVQVIGRLVEDEGVGAGEHHLGEHTADTLPTG